MRAAAFFAGSYHVRQERCCAADLARPASPQARWREDRLRHRVRGEHRRARGRGRRRSRPRRRFSRHGRAGPREHAAGDDGRDGLPHGLRRTRIASCVPRRRPAVHGVPRRADCIRQRDTPRRGRRRGDGQARRRGLGLRDHFRADFARDSRLRASGAHAAVDQSPRRLSRARPRDRSRRTPARRRARRAGRGRATAGARMRAVRARAGDHARAAHSRHRHRRGRGLRRTGARHARPAWHHARQAAAVFQGFPRRLGFRRRRDRRLRTRRACRRIPGPEHSY
jgi:hypothetical protein